ncbi:MAG: hypothetical protein JNM56_39390 [Planctomycetia bacterium]|nr:hypothetical protein [Planctomycetia bacterium]
MIAHGSTAPRDHQPRRALGLTLACALWLAATAGAQTELASVPAVDLPSAPASAANPPAPELRADPIPASVPATGVMQAGCRNCSNGLFGLPSSPPPQPGGNGCASSYCNPGRQPCHPCIAESCVGRMICGVYECICCPDHCYEARWLPVADTAFHTAAARPITQQRFRWDRGINLILPDRNEYFWPRVGGNGGGEGPTPVAPFQSALYVNYDVLSIYTETAAGGVLSIIVEMPYIGQDAAFANASSGFGDITLGTKTLMFDCELLQISLQMLTTIPTGNFVRGLGRSLVSLEPSLIIGVKLAPETYYQGQLSQWVPLGGDGSYAGGIMHFHAAINQVLFRPLPDVPLIGTLELSGWFFQDGAYTDPILGPNQSSGGAIYLMPSLGLRLFVCDKIDFGISASFAVTDEHFAEQLYRSEFRFRF